MKLELHLPVLHGQVLDDSLKDGGISDLVSGLGDVVFIVPEVEGAEIGDHRVLLTRDARRRNSASPQTDHHGEVVLVAPPLQKPHLLTIPRGAFPRARIVHHLLQALGQEVLEGVLVVRRLEEPPQREEKMRAPLWHLAHAVVRHRVAQERVVRRHPNRALHRAGLPSKRIDGHDIGRKHAVRPEAVESRPPSTLCGVLNPRGLAFRVRWDGGALGGAEGFELPQANALVAPVRAIVLELDAQPPRIEGRGSEHPRRPHDATVENVPVAPAVEERDAHVPLPIRHVCPLPVVYGRVWAVLRAVPNRDGRALCQVEGLLERRKGINAVDHAPKVDDELAHGRRVLLVPERPAVRDAPEREGDVVLEFSSLIHQDRAAGLEPLLLLDKARPR
mmetsp:Transcript_15200/g.37084  ORF Transcript_15200/g.37084 Transcript_15200/m.37084 type:complete len:390 (+) Transcript_15200:185-1354(+)